MRQADWRIAVGQQCWASTNGVRQDAEGETPGVVRRGPARHPARQRPSGLLLRSRDYLCYLQALREAVLRYACQVHAYVLMTNHVHLLLTPADAGAVAKVMQAVGRRYVRHVNDSTGRTGTLWEGRYKASLVDSERYLLACYRCHVLMTHPVRPRAWGRLDGINRRASKVTKGNVA